MSVEGMGNRFQPSISKLNTGNINNTTNLNNKNTVEDKKIESPTFNLKNAMNFSKLDKREFATELKFVSSENKQSIGLNTFNKLANSIDLDKGSKEVMARNILMQLRGIQ